MATTTALALITTGMREASGLLASGVAPTSDEQSQYLGLLNSLLDQMNAQSQFIYHIAELGISWAATVGSKTIGPSGADVTAVRPTKLDDAVFWRDAAGYDTPVSVVEVREMSQVRDKSVATADIPWAVGYEAASPNGTIRLYPTPETSGELFVRLWTQLTSIDIGNIAANVTFPPGYQRFLELRLAFSICRQNGYPVPQDLAMEMKEAEGIVKRLNGKVPVLRSPFEITNGMPFNINRG